jgi:hypothetical protein
MNFHRFLLLILVAFLATGPAVAEQKQSLLLQRSAGEHVSISDSAQTGLDLAGNFTLEAWVKPTTQIPSGQEYVIISKWSSTVANKSYHFQYYHDGSQTTLRLSTAATSTSDDYGAGVAYVLPTTIWTHVAVVFTASTGTAEFFVDARSIGSAGGYGTTVNNGTGDFQIGIRQGLAATAFDGYIDEVRVWNVARTSAQLASAFATVSLGPQTGLVGHWRFTCEYTDDSGNGNSLSPVNYPAFAADTPFGCGQACISCS